MSIYRGFSTVSSDAQKKFVLTDTALIKQDLLNVLKTKLGSRVMQPSIGCVCYEKLFENLSQTDVEDISDNIQSIIKNDPRINLISLDISPAPYSINVSITINYVGTNQTEQLLITYENDMNEF